MTSCKRQSHQRHGEPKLFQCTGFGDCNMVFTRSEHLARHARKHTGEKPFKCVVPGCERAFSRFDNMVQHTSTHSKHHDKKRVHGKKQNKTRPAKASNIDASNKTASSKTLETLTPLSPPMSSSSSPQTSPDSPDSPLLYDNDVYKHQRLPSITESLYYLSPITPSMDDFPPLNSNKYIQSTCLPSPKELYLHVDSLAASGDEHFLIGGNDYPMSTSYRKLSPTELALPIQDLSTTHGNGNVGVDVTLDEFEALQGMSRLAAELRPTTSFFDKPRHFSHVNSFRQHLPYAQNPNILHRHCAPLTL